ncbi:alpha/beta hydrolase [Aspergillus candidus]|uniref:Toxin biosynthesis protein n=1 Tax=Aspergillus candidus TaxID=41067 RepID=A0A2I2F3F2_ASPCN|nr:toxin biosynthesis protein [Aspergillus candidus]PLB35154.1 toxin biosynthesis protein [Aspergillus candidus]
MSKSSFAVEEHVLDGQHIREYPGATITPDAPIKLAVKKYIPLDNPNPQPGNVTIIGSHGAGFPKELYEPLWEAMLARSEKDGYRIRAIWIVDSAHQGASGVLNERIIGNDPSWFDHSRDLLHMINHFRDDMPRPIIGVGHSTGATQLIFLSLIHARLFASLVMIEPYFIGKERHTQGLGTLASAIQRKDTWPSRSAADKHFRKAFRVWDPAVLDRWTQYGLRDLPTALHPEINSERHNPPVTLTTTKHQEAFFYTRSNFNQHRELGAVYAGEASNDPRPPHDPLLVPDMVGPLHPGQKFYRPEPVLAFTMLPHLRPEVLVLSAARSALFRSGIHDAAVKMIGTRFAGSGGLEYGHVRHDVVQKAGHTLPMEKVAETAALVGPWVGGKLRKWSGDEKWMAAIEVKPVISEEWIAELKARASSDKSLARKKLSKL